MAKYEVTKSVDVRGEVCHVPDVETKRSLEKMKAGEILEVCIDYAMSMERIPEAVRAKGHEVLEIDEVGNSKWKIYIKVN
ncbi:sulfurtransferase TusA family protein [Mesotoga sp. UBA6090]|uniref:sulfurtransferase TusA family protein n=1 Tax=Mesotoga sp. UBA6090 TaxID=1946860 RepID=UPI0025F10BEA|nr:sulfurtransferase TusA family protein [Mesotoga sp. UBA6090]